MRRRCARRCTRVDSVLNVVCLMAYGDALITLSLIEDLPRDPDRWRVIGTGVTAKVSALLRRPIPVTEILPDKAAFNTIKERGLHAAVHDFRIARRELRLCTAPGDVLAFERSDWRNRALLSPGRRGDYAPRLRGAYADRLIQAERLFGTMRPWPPGTAPQRAIRTVMINPCARYRNRWLSARLMDNVLRLCTERGWKLTLVDPCAQYVHHAEHAERYLRRPSLEQAADALRGVDLYIGPDSFFVHLAYYYAIPHFAFFHPDNLYFQTPGMRENANWCSFADAEQYESLRAAVLGYVGDAR